MSVPPPRAAAPGGGLVRPKYRADIDGLRGIAVLAVLGFHYFPSWVPGGFVGVDVFFVISGYLISSIIFASLENDSFSFAAFYARRVRRIFPALLLVMIATLAAVWFAFSPITREFHRVGRHAAAGAGFVLNFVFWREAGYFDAASRAKPLLHLWSLAIEEQFYIVWPLMLWLARKRKHGFLTVTLAVAAASFALSVRDARVDPVAAFYSPLSRFWELMLGGLLARLTLSGDLPEFRTPDLPASAGLALLAAGILLLRGGGAFPGWEALLPTLGAFLVIAAGRDSWLNKNLFGARALVWIGLVSYPLYLWHWPALCVVRAFGLAPSRLRVAKLLLIPACLLLSWLTYELVEKPIRRGRHGGAAVAGLSLAMLATAAFGYAESRGRFDSARFPPARLREISRLREAAEPAEGTAGLRRMYGDKPCFIFERRETYRLFLDNGCFDRPFPGRPTVFLIGDSHSASLSLGLRPFLLGRRINFVQASSGWCEPTMNDASDAWCADINALVFKEIAKLKPDVVVFDAYWLAASAPPYFVGGGDYDALLLRTLEKIKRLGAGRIVVVGEIPVWRPSLPDELYARFTARGKPVPERTYRGVDPDSLRMDARMRSLRYPRGVVYFSLKDRLCGTRGCLVKVGPDLSRDLLVWDYGHMTVSASKYVVDRFLGPRLIRLIRARDPRRP